MLAQMFKKRLLRGAKASAELIDPDVAFVVDCSPANDMKGKQNLSGELGQGH